MKKRFIIPLVLLITLVLIGVSAFFWWKENIKPASGNITKQRFVVSRGLTASQVGQKLYDAGLIKNVLAFKIYVQVFDKTKNINAGEFTLSPSTTLAEIVSILGKGPEELWVTIPEGLRKEEVVERLISGLEMDAGKAGSFRDEFLIEASDKEGQLFPDTYLFPRDIKATVAVNKMIDTFETKIDQKMKEDISGSGKDLEEILAMASLIERETKTNEERPIVAGILWKRLDNKWPLQVDATLQYAISTEKCKLSTKGGLSSGQNIENCSNWWPILTKDDLEIRSPFNTYKYTGLPPAAIANPGLSSIKAAIYPEASDFWFYIHSPDGKIHYAKTITEHNLNIKKYLGK